MMKIDSAARVDNGHPGSSAQSVRKAGLSTTLLANHWYVVALTDEIEQSPLARTVAGEPVVVYRTADGALAALADRCPHRGYPLSAGTISGNLLVCGYHGFTFDGSGMCVHVPGQSDIPRAAAVRTFALCERGSFVWIWLGEPGGADPAQIPDHSWDRGAGWTSFSDACVIAARHGLIVDNLLDLSHETFVHAGTIGSRDVAETPIMATAQGRIVRVSRHMAATECPPFYAESTGMSTPIDRWQDIEYHAPSLYVLHVRIAPAGADDERAVFLKIVYGITPVDADSTRLFWSVARDFALGRDDVTRTLRSIQAVIVSQDRAALERLETFSAEHPGSEVSVNFDRGALLARRVHSDLAAQQAWRA